MQAIGNHAKQVTRFDSCLLWKLNIYGGTLGAFGGFSIVLLLTRPRAGLHYWYAFLVANLLLCLTAYFPGNVGGMWPCVVEVHRDAGLRLFYPFREVWIPITEIYAIEDEPLWQGYVIRFRGNHRLLTLVVIHWFFGPQRKALAQAIQEEIDRKDERFER